MAQIAHSSIGLRLLIGLAMLLSLISCAQPADNAAPVATVQAFVSALEARDASALIQLLEPSDWRKEIGPELRSYLNHVERFELLDESYTVEQNDGSNAVVRLSGTLQYAMVEEGPSGEQAVDLNLELVQIDGAWYLRSLELPQPGGSDA